MKLDFFIRSFGWLMLCMVGFTHAQQYDHNYLKWKETQQAQDEKLNYKEKYLPHRITIYHVLLFSL